MCDFHFFQKEMPSEGQLEAGEHPKLVSGEFSSAKNVCVNLMLSKKNCLSAGG